MSDQETRSLFRKSSVSLFVAALGLAAVLTACNKTSNPEPEPPAGCPETYDSLYTPLCVLVDTGMVVFEGNCTGCHQNGYGIPGATPPLINSDFFMNNRYRTMQILLAGTGDSLFVNGMWYQGSMPEWSHLTNTEIAGVLTYVRSVLNDSTVTSCVTFNPNDTSTFNEDGFARCQKVARSQAARDADSVAVWEVKIVRDSINALPPL